MEKQVDIDLSNTKFCIGMPVNRDLSIHTTLSLLYTFRKFDKENCPLAIAIEVGNSIVCSARNKVVHTFLTKTDADVLFFVDSDITWTVDDFVTVAALATVHDIVGVAYPTKNDADPKMFVNFVKNSEDKFIYNEYGLPEIYGCGFGFIAIKRSVFEKLKPITETYKDGGEDEIHRFFKIDTQDGFLVGEDIYFLKRWVKELGYKAYIIPSIELGHVGQKVYRGSLLQTNIFQEDV